MHSIIGKKVLNAATAADTAGLKRRATLPRPHHDSPVVLTANQDWPVITLITSTASTLQNYMAMPSKRELLEMLKQINLSCSQNNHLQPEYLPPAVLELYESFQLNEGN